MLMQTGRAIGLSAVALATWLATAAVAEIPADRADKIDDAAPDTAPAEPKQPRRVLVFLTPPHLMPKVGEEARLSSQRMTPLRDRPPV